MFSQKTFVGTVLVQIHVETMGSVSSSCRCAKRKIVFEVVTEDNDDWELVSNSYPISAHTHVRFRKLVRRVVRLIRLRWLWSTCMSMLNTPRMKHRSQLRNRQNISKLTTQLKQYYVQHLALFTHVERQRGKLVFKNKSIEIKYHSLITPRRP